MYISKSVRNGQPLTEVNCFCLSKNCVFYQIKCKKIWIKTLWKTFTDWNRSEKSFHEYIRNGKIRIFSGRVKIQCKPFILFVVGASFIQILLYTPYFHFYNQFILYYISYFCTIFFCKQVYIDIYQCFRTMYGLFSVDIFFHLLTNNHVLNSLEILLKKRLSRSLLLKNFFSQNWQCESLSSLIK